MRVSREIFEFAEGYWSGEVARKELPELTRLYRLASVLEGVNGLADAFIHEDVARFVIAAELPLIPARRGCWSINEGDERVKDFSPE